MAAKIARRDAPNAASKEAAKPAAKASGGVAIAIGAGALAAVAILGAFMLARSPAEAPEPRPAPPRQMTAEEEIAKRVPRVAPRGAGENPGGGLMERPAAIPERGVEIQKPPERPPVVATVARLSAPTPGMMEGVPTKGVGPALAVDEKGYSTLPDGRRVKVNGGPGGLPRAAGVVAPAPAPEPGLAARAPKAAGSSDAALAANPVWLGKPGQPMAVTMTLPDGRRAAVGAGATAEEALLFQEMQRRDFAERSVKRQQEQKK